MSKFIYFILLLCIFSCSEFRRPRFPIKKVTIKGKEFIEWYNYSNISGFGIDMVDFVDSQGDRTLIYKSHYLSDIEYDSGVIKLKWWQREKDQRVINDISRYKIKIDSGGCSLMSSDSRRGNAEWNENVCTRYSKLIEFEREHPYQYDELVGIWQDMPEIASGWTDNYQFFDNGKFIFNFNQMICDKRIIKISGKWKKEDNQELKLTVTSKTIIEGGRLVPASGSCGSDFEIEGGILKEIKLEKFETKTLRLSEIQIDQKHENLSKLEIGGKYFWKLNYDPTKYR